MPKLDTILFIEDEPYYQKVYGKVLENAGYKVVYASNGDEAQKLIQKKDFDLLVVDLVMPIVSGLSFLKVVKKRKQKVIVLTTLDTDTDRQDAINSGADLFLNKLQTKPQLLLTHIKKMIG